MYGPVVAVIGGSGFVGAHVVRELMAKKIGCRPSYQKGDPLWHVADLDCPWQMIELERVSSVRSFLRQAAALIYCPRLDLQEMTHKREAKRRGVRQLRIILDACRAEGVGRIVYVSTAATMVVDEPAGKRGYDESGVYVPGSRDDVFFEARGVMEAEIYRYVATGSDLTMVLPTTPVGPDDVEMGAAGLIRALATGWVPQAGAEQLVNFVDVRDVASGVVAALQRGRSGRRYALAGQNLRVERLVKIVTEQSGRDTELGTVADQRRDLVGRFKETVAHGLGLSPGRPQQQYLLERALRIGPVSNQRLRGELAVTPRRPEQSVADTVEWLCRVGALGWRGGQLCRPGLPL